MGRRGPKPDFAKRAAVERLLAEGSGLRAAAREVGVNPRTVQNWLSGYKIVSGGRVLELPPVIAVSAAAPKSYSPRYLSEDERVRLGDLRREGLSMRQIGILMGRSASTISRELARGCDSSGRYRPFEAQRRAMARRRIQRASRLARDPELREWVTTKLQSRWSPEQTARQLRREFPDRSDRWLYTETIYQAVYRPDLGGLPRELPGRVLRYRRRQRLPRRHAQSRRPGVISNRTLIHQRPPEALDRVQAGHWEGDLIMGAGNASAIATLVERTTRFTILGYLPEGHHDAETARDCVVKALSHLPAHLRRTLTWDQGKEMARHAEIAATLTGTAIYFCDPHSPWQRPSNENVNGLLRAHFPKGTDLSVHSADDLVEVQTEFNNRPRRVLDWDSPARRFATLLENRTCCDPD